MYILLHTIFITRKIDYLGKKVTLNEYNVYNKRFEISTISFA